MPEWCQAGRRAKLRGVWTIPCTEADNKRHHYIAAPGIDPIELCDKHFEQIERMGLVSDPYLSEDEYRARGGKAPWRD